MFMYAIGTLPLIHSLRDPSCWKQIWYADDASAGALWKIFMNGFLFFVFGVQHLAISLNLLRALLLLVNIVRVKLKIFFMIWEFRLLLAIDILAALLEICMTGMCLYTIKLTSE